MSHNVVAIFDTPRLAQSFQAQVAELRAGGVQVDVRGALAEVPPALRDDCDVLIFPGHLPLTAEALSHWPRLRAVVAPFTGIEGIDVAAAEHRLVVVANGQSEENAESLAEATLLLGLAALYDLAGVQAVLRGEATRPSPPKGRLLTGKQVGVIGYGPAARGLIRRLAGWRAPIIVHTRTPPATTEGDVRFAALETVLRDSDIIFVLASLNAGNRHMLNAERLAMTKLECVLVNTARGGLIDEAALAALLAARPGLRAALDVFEVEPLPPSSPLRQLPNVVLTPHMLSHTRDAVASLGPLMLANVRAVLNADLPPCLCNPKLAAAWRAKWARPFPYQMESSDTDKKGLSSNI